MLLFKKLSESKLLKFYGMNAPSFFRLLLCYKMLERSIDQPPPLQSPQHKWFFSSVVFGRFSESAFTNKSTKYFPVLHTSVLPTLHTNEVCAYAFTIFNERPLKLHTFLAEKTAWHAAVHNLIDIVRCSGTFFKGLKKSRPSSVLPRGTTFSKAFYRQIATVFSKNPRFTPI